MDTRTPTPYNQQCSTVESTLNGRRQPHPDHHQWSRSGPSAPPGGRFISLRALDRLLSGACPPKRGGGVRLRAPRRATDPRPKHVGTLTANAITYGDVDIAAHTVAALGDLSHHDLTSPAPSSCGVTFFVGKRPSAGGSGLDRPGPNRRLEQMPAPAIASALPTRTQLARLDQATETRIEATALGRDRP